MHIRYDDLEALTGTSLHIIYDSETERLPDLTDGVAENVRVSDIRADSPLPMYGLFEVSGSPEGNLVASSPFAMLLEELARTLSHWQNPDMSDALDNWSANGTATLQVRRIF
jgi:hypothetical protein